MSNTRTKYYKVVNGSRSSGHLHTNPDCDRLTRGKSQRRVFRDQYPNSEICPRCAGTEKKPTEQDHSMYNRLLEIANGD